MCTNYMFVNKAVNTVEPLCTLPSLAQEALGSEGKYNLHVEGKYNLKWMALMPCFYPQRSQVLFTDQKLVLRGEKLSAVNFYECYRPP